MDRKGSLYMFLDYKVQINCQQMSHAVRNTVSVKVNLFDTWHLALVGLNLSTEQQLLKAIDTIAYKHYNKALTKRASRRRNIRLSCSQKSSSSTEVMMFSNSCTPTCGSFLGLWFGRRLGQCLCNLAPDVVKRVTTHVVHIALLPCLFPHVFLKGCLFSCTRNSKSHLSKGTSQTQLQQYTFNTLQHMDVYNQFSQK